MENKIGEKKLWLFPLFTILFTSLFSSFLMGVYAPSPSYRTVETGYYFKSTDSGGLIQFGSTCTMYGWYWSGNLIRFKQVDLGDECSELGINAPSGVNITVNSISKTRYLGDTVNYTVYAPSGNATTKIYFSGRTPRSVLGESSYSMNEDTGILTVNTAHSSPVTVIVQWEITGEIPQADNPADSMMSQYLMIGDISGYIIAQYVSIMGTIFFVFLLMPPVLGTYIRAGLIPAMIVMFLLWGVVYKVFPGLGLNLIIILLAVGVGILIASLFIGRRTTI